MKTKTITTAILLAASTAISFGTMTDGDKNLNKDMSVNEIKKLCKSKEASCYYENDMVKSIHDLKSGKYISYYTSGNVEEVGYFINNKTVGEFNVYYPEGKIWRKFYYSENGKKEGLQTYYYKNGQIMIQGIWENGKATENIVYYNSNGEVKRLDDPSSYMKINNVMDMSLCENGEE